MPFALLNLPAESFPGWGLCLLVLVGLAGLSYGGDWLTTGAAAVSRNLRIDPVVVGLTVVSMATSMPEMLTSLLAARESPGLALGNIIGSNVANTGLILGVTALIAPLVIQLRLIRREVPILLAVTALFYFFGLGGYNRLEGVILLALTVAYLVFVVHAAKRESSRVAEGFESEEPDRSTGSACWLVLGGGALLALGADGLVTASAEIAGRLGVSDVLVGLTIVAIGTSLPELAASVAAARAGHADICAGNIVGSNLFNILLIGGGVAVLIPIPVDSSLLIVEFPALIVLTGLLFWMFKTGRIVSRQEGLVLLLLYLSTLGLSSLSQLDLLF